MKNKRTIFALLAALIATTFAAGAMAQCGRAWGGGPMGCPIGGPMSLNGATAVAPETLQKFNKETKGLQEQLIDKQAFLKKEWLKDDPDPDAIANIQKSIVDIQRDMQKAAKKLGMKGCYGACPTFMGCGGGGGCRGMDGMPMGHGK